MITEPGWIGHRALVQWAIMPRCDADPETTRVHGCIDQEVVWAFLVGMRGRSLEVEGPRSVLGPRAEVN